jgi:putative hydrolase of HD superfamily
MEHTAKLVLLFIKFAERLKNELRHSWLSSGRQESVAEHTWQMALMALLVAKHLEHPVNLERCLKMILVHDLVEAEAGDIPFFEQSERQLNKSSREAAAINRIRDMLPVAEGLEIYELWHEFEDQNSVEARFVKALDTLEVQIQHNLASLESWEDVEFDLVYTKLDEPCEHDAFLRVLSSAVKGDAEKKMKEEGVDVLAVKKRAIG